MILNFKRITLYRKRRKNTIFYNKAIDKFNNLPVNIGRYIGYLLGNMS